MKDWKSRVKKCFKFIVGLAFVLGVGVFAFGEYSVMKASETNTNPSPALIELMDSYHLQPLPRRPVDCFERRYENYSKMAASISFNSIVDSARSAELAATRFKNSGNDQFGKMATEDALIRWERAWEIQDRMRCADLQSIRRSY